MQQLASIQRNEKQIIVQWQHKVDYDNWVNVAQSLLAKTPDVTVLELSSGADRHAIYFNYHSVKFAFYYEDYSDTSWIEVLQEDNESLLADIENALRVICR